MLISTKIHPPQLKSNLLERKHLTERLTDGRKSQLILITGPAGYGKTSLAGQWIRDDKLKAAWYSIDDTDNDFDIFFRYLLTSLIEAENGFERILGPILQDQTQFKVEDVIPMVIHALNTLPEDLYVILDDYHMINSNDIHHALARMIKYLPSRVHIAIISRHKLPQSLCRYKFQYDMVEITPDDLRFSERETEHFFKNVIPLDLTLQQIRELNRFAGGWVAGFQIFGLSLKGKESLTESDRILKTAGWEAIDYLINEVVSVQSEKVRSFLYQTAVLNRFNADVCRYVTGQPDAGKLLNNLLQKNLFLVSLDTEHKWYRYHQLFTEAVKQWVTLSFPGLVEKTQKKAAQWFARHHYLEEAFQYAFASGDFEFAADMLEDYPLFLFEIFEVASSLRWISRLPREVFLRRPLLRLFECAFKINTMQMDDVAGVLTEIEASHHNLIEGYAEPKKTLCLDLLVYLKTVPVYYQGIFDVDIQKISNGIEKISDKNRPLAGYLKILIAGTYLYQGDLMSAEKYIKMASVDIFPSESVLAKMNWVNVMASTKRFQGRMKESEKILQEAFEFLSERKLYDTPLKYLLYLPMAWIFYQRNELDKALEYGMLSLRYNERAGQVDSILQGYFLLSGIYTAKGDFKSARDYAQKLKSLSESLNFHSMSNFTEALSSFHAISRGEGDILKSRPNMDKRVMSEAFSFLSVFETWSLSFSLLYRGELSEASTLLEALRNRCAKRDMMEIVLEIDILRAGVFRLINQNEKAKRIMEQAISFSEKEGYIRPFVNHAPLIYSILKELNGSSTASGRSTHLKVLLKACDVQKNGTPVEANTIAPKNEFGLTEREIEILRLMSDGYKNKQIADMSFISINTVKTHGRHIFKKLGVKSRLQAIIKAKELLHPP